MWKTVCAIPRARTKTKAPVRPQHLTVTVTDGEVLVQSEHDGQVLIVQLDLAQGLHADAEVVVKVDDGRLERVENAPKDRERRQLTVAQMKLVAVRVEQHLRAEQLPPARRPERTRATIGGWTRGRQEQARVPLSHELGVQVISGELSPTFAVPRVAMTDDQNSLL